MNMNQPRLKRSLSLYGFGNIPGAGIYVLIGKVAATAGVCIHHDRLPGPVDAAFIAGGKRWCESPACCC